MNPPLPLGPLCASLLEEHAAQRARMDAHRNAIDADPDYHDEDSDTEDELEELCGCRHPTGRPQKECPDCRGSGWRAAT